MKFAFPARALVCAFPCLAMAQVAILHIHVTDGEEAVYAAGAKSARPLSVAISDENGRPISGAAVSFRLPDDGPGGVFANGLRTDVVVTDANGRATVRNLQLNRTPGAFQVRITAAKEQARAGTLARQYIAGAGADSPARPAPEMKAKSGKKWVVLGLVAAGVAGGLGAGVAGHSTPSHPAPSTPTISVGDPTVTVGKP